MRLMAAEQPELVLLDLLLTGTDCIELMRQMLEIDDVPVIFLSTHGREEQVARAFDQGAADAWSSPSPQRSGRPRSGRPYGPAPEGGGRANGTLPPRRPGD